MWFNKVVVGNKRTKDGRQSGSAKCFGLKFNENHISTQNMLYVAVYKIQFIAVCLNAELYRTKMPQDDIGK